MSEKSQKLVTYIGIIYSVAILITGACGFIWGGAVKAANISNSIQNIKEIQATQQIIINNLSVQYAQLDKTLCVHMRDNELVIGTIQKNTQEIKESISRLEQLFIKKPMSRADAVDKNL